MSYKNYKYYAKYVKLDIHEYIIIILHSNVLTKKILFLSLEQILGPKHSMVVFYPQCSDYKKYKKKKKHSKTSIVHENSKTLNFQKLSILSQMSFRANEKHALFVEVET